MEYNKEEWEIEYNKLIKYKGQKESVTIPSAVTTTNYYAFAACVFTKEIIIKKEGKIELNSFPPSLEVLTVSSKSIVLVPKNITIKELRIYNFDSLSNLNSLLHKVNTNKIVIYGHRPNFTDLMSLCENLDYMIPIYYQGEEIEVLPPDTIDEVTLKYVKLKEINFPEGIKTIEIPNWLLGLETLILPKSTTKLKINFRCFTNRGYIRNLVIPDSIETIEIPGHLMIECIYIRNNEGNLFETMEKLSGYLEDRYYRPQVIILDPQLNYFMKRKLNKFPLKYGFNKFAFEYRSEATEEIFTIPKIGELLPLKEIEINDQEISRVLREATDLTKYLTYEERIDIEIEIKSLLDKYITNLENLKNKVDFSEASELKLYNESPSNLRNNLLITLNRLIFSLNNVSDYRHKLEEIRECETALNSTTESSSSPLTAKVLFIKEIYQKYHNEVMLRKFKTELKNQKQQISELVATNINNTTLDLEKSHTTDITSLVTKYYTSCQSIELLDQTFKCQTDNKLSLYIAKIKETISIYSKEQQLLLEEKLARILSTYIDRALNNENLNLVDIEIEIRTELMSFLNEIMILSPNLINYKKTLDDLDLSLKLLADTPEKFESNSIISSLVSEITELLQKTSLNADLKLEIRSELTKVLSKWKNKIINNEPLLPEKENLGYPFINIPPRIELTDPNLNLTRYILNDLFRLKLIITTTISRNEECDALLNDVMIR